jgi:peptide/nickel transport system substrate-binding protein
MTEPTEQRADSTEDAGTQSASTQHASTEKTISRRRLLTSAGKFGVLAASGGVSTLWGGWRGRDATSVLASAGLRSAAVAASPKPVQGGTLSAALTGNPTSMDPAIANIYTGDEVYDNIFSKLIEMQSDGSFGPSLATSWAQTSATTWTFDLVDNAMFHNGEKFSANDVKYTFDRILNKATGSPYVPNYAIIDGIEVISPTKVVFHLKSPYGPFLTNLCLNAQIVNQKAIETQDPKVNPVGTGPFKFVNWVQNEKIDVTRFDQYFKVGQPYLDGVSFQFLPNAESRVQALGSGQLDWADAVPLQQLPTLKKSSQVTVVSSSAAGIPDFLALNCSKPPFNNKALRQAVAYAISSSEIVELAYFGVGAEVGAEEVGSASPWFGGNNPYRSGPNLALAKAKMREAGYPHGLTIEYLGLPQYPNLLTTGEVIQSQLAKIGITMKIQQLEVTTWVDKYATADYQATTAYWAGTVDPDNFYSNIILSTAAENFTKYANPKVDALIGRANTLTTLVERKPIYEKIRALVWEDAPLVFTAYETTNYVMTPHVHGSTINPPLDLRMGQIWKTA